MKSKGLLCKWARLQRITSLAQIVNLYNKHLHGWWHPPTESPKQNNWVLGRLPPGIAKLLHMPVLGCQLHNENRSRQHKNGLFMLKCDESTTWRRCKFSSSTRSHGSMVFKVHATVADIVARVKVVLALMRDDKKSKRLKCWKNAVVFFVNCYWRCGVFFCETFGRRQVLGCP